VKRSMVLAVAVSISTLMVGACGSSSGDSSDTSVATSAVAETAPPDTNGPAPLETTVAETAPAETAPAETTPVETTPEETIAAEPTAAETASTLAADSPTCKAFATVKETNDASGELTNSFQVKIAELAPEGEPTAEDLANISKEWDVFRKDFLAMSDDLVGKLQGAYSTLAKEQPQFADDFAILSDITPKLLAVFGDSSFEDLATIQTRLTQAVPTNVLTAAGQSTLKIDEFSKQACGIPFANT
jgi:hypothetical protein